MLKHAIIRINEDTQEIEVLISYDLSPELVAAAERNARWGSRKSAVKHVSKAYQSVVDSIKNETMKLP